MTRPEPPAPVVAAATARAEARERHDWTTADQLRAEIEAAGWTVTDDADRFRLHPAHPADLDVDGLVRYGWSGAVPRRGRDTDRLGVTIAIVVGASVAASATELGSAAARRDPAAAPSDAQILVIFDGLGRTDPPDARTIIESAGPIEVIATARQVGPAGCLDIVIRRALGDRVVMAWDDVPEPAVLAALLVALDDAAVAIAGLHGLSLDRLPRLEPTASGASDAVSLDNVAFRFDEAAELGEPDFRLRTRAGVGAWLSRGLVAASGLEGDRRVAVVGVEHRTSGAVGRLGDATVAALRRDGYRLLRDRA